MKVIISHPTSNQFNRSALSGLLQNKMLGDYYTSLASFKGSMLHYMGGIPPFSDIRRRSFQSELKPFTHSSPFLEMGRMMAGKLGLSSLVRHESGLFCVDSVYQQLDKKVSSRLKKAAIMGARSVYAYEDGALQTFREAHRLGINCFYDLPIGYWRTAHKLLQKEKEIWPEWSSTLTGLKDSGIKLARKDEELALADRIFVASSFTASTLKDYPGKLSPVEVIPYGFPPITNKPISTSRKSGPLKLLFVGGLSQRKGVANLFSAVKTLVPHVSLTIVGKKTSQPCPALDAALKQHTWIPSLPHREILELMREHDVLVFPSLFEGFGMVITEAMSQGTPVITTNRTAGPDFIQHGKNGWLVEAGSTEALRAAIEDIIDKPELIAKAGREAMETARQRPWEVYGKELADALQRAQELPRHNIV